MQQKDGWNRLIEALDAWTSAAEVAPDRIEVSLPQSGASSRVVVVMTPNQWEDMAGVMWGDFDSALQDVKQTLLGLQPDERFAVYSDYRLEPSNEPTLPETPDVTPAPGGEWMANNGEGRVASRFADWSEPDRPSGAAGRG